MIIIVRDNVERFNVLADTRKINYSFFGCYERESERERERKKERGRERERERERERDGDRAVLSNFV
jgi:hypothetical protein